MEELGQHADPGGHSFFHLRFQQTQMQVKAGLRKGVSNPQHVSSLPRADHSPLSHTYVLAVTLPELSCLLFLCLQAATLLSNGDSVSGQITPRMMWRDKRWWKLPLPRSDVHSSHQRLMLLHWPCLPVGTGLDGLGLGGRQEGRSFQDFTFIGHESVLVAAMIKEWGGKEWEERGLSSYCGPGTTLCGSHASS